MLGRLTWMKKDITKLEEKEGLTPSDLRKIKRLKELAKEHDHEFEQHHIEVLNFIQADDTPALDSEEIVFDEHVNRVLEIIAQLEQLEDLVMTTKPLRHHAFDEREVTSGLLKNQKQLKYMKSGVDKSYGTVRTLEPMPDLDVCLVEKLKKDIDALTKTIWHSGGYMHVVTPER